MISSSMGMRIVSGPWVVMFDLLRLGVKLICRYLPLLFRRTFDERAPTPDRIKWVQNLEDPCLVSLLKTPSVAKSLMLLTKRSKLG